MEFVANTFDTLFAKAVGRINQKPQYICSPRGQKIKEAIAPTLILTNPRARLLANPARDVKYGFGAGEFIWYFTGRNDLEMMLYYNKRMRDYSDDGKTLNSAYGFRFRMPMETGAPNQWEIAKRTLLKDPDTRRALILINEPFDQYEAELHGSKDVPCTLSLQFFIRENKLHLHAHMRSNDAFWGLTYDLFSFTLFQECMLLELQIAGMKDLELGEYVHTAGSLHIYERHFGMADSVLETYLDERFQQAAPMEPLSLGGLSLLIEEEEALRTGKVAQIDEAQFDGGARWMAQQLNAHRRQRDAERVGKGG